MNQVASYQVTWFFSKCRDTPPPVTSCVVWKTIPLKIHADIKACGLRQHLLQVKISFENLIAWSLEFGFGVSASHANLCIFKFSSLFCKWSSHLQLVTGFWCVTGLSVPRGSRFPGVGVKINCHTGANVANNSNATPVSAKSQLGYFFLNTFEVNIVAYKSNTWRFLPASEIQHGSDLETVITLRYASSSIEVL